ncbi:hypothetical protein BDV95DRAFT_571692 [Massariosphaeria phaeospora]|uniref:Uncharacterized protein n=1 Tax=Massariosphaeria phaeospora TaxID=100035 RepID=A0A7C8M8S8_9PLEO|nr:hypothetical protein BDV95DRAFT_571692 [Massariosphaeria phaeospora]
MLLPILRWLLTVSADSMLMHPIHELLARHASTGIAVQLALGEVGMGIEEVRLAGREKRGYSSPLRLSCSFCCNVHPAAAHQLSDISRRRCSRLIWWTARLRRARLLLRLIHAASAELRVVCTSQDMDGNLST